MEGPDGEWTADGGRLRRVVDCATAIACESEFAVPGGMED